MTSPYKGADGALFPLPSYVAGKGYWINKIPVPADGDYNNEATFAPGYHGLADRTVWLAWRCIDIVGGGSYDNAALQFNGFFLFTGEADFYDLRCTDGSWPTLEPARVWERHSLRLHTTGREKVDGDGAGMDYPDAWITNEGGFRAIQTRSTQSALRYSEIELYGLPDGGLFTDVEILSIGVTGASSFPITYAQYRVARYQGDGPYEYLSAEVADVHVDGDYESTTLATVIPLAADTIVNKDYVYVLIVKHPHKVGAPSGPMYLRDVKSSGTAGRLGL
jgi:hypothetical protein